MAWPISLCQAVFEQGGIFKHLWGCGVVWGACWGYAEGVLFSFESLHIPPSEMGKYNPGCRKKSVENRSNDYRKKGSFITGAENGGPGGKGEGEGVSPVSKFG